MKQQQAERLLLLGRSGVGKSYSGYQYALQQIQEGRYDPSRVIIMSKTYKSDPSQKGLIKYCMKKVPKFVDTNCFEDIDLDLMREVYDTQKQLKDSNKKIHMYLFLFDDQISSGLIKRQDKDPILKDFFCVGRHYNITQYWLLQRYANTIDPSCKDQFTRIAIFKQGNKKALLDLLQDYDENPDIDHKNTVKQMYSDYLESVASNSGHGCYVINCLVAFGDGRYQMNLTADKYFDKQ